MNFFDDAVFSGLHLAGQKSALFDYLMHAVVASALVKGALLMAVFWGLWFAGGDELSVRRSRETLLATLIGAVLAMAVTKGLEAALPLKLRPINAPGFLYLPPDPPQGILDFWSSFPSDHAALFAALVAGLWFVSRSLFFFMSLYILVLVFFPRIYLGLHYPVDVAAGAALGIFAATLCNWPKIRPKITEIFITWSEKYPASFYGLAFLFWFEVGTVFGNLRRMLKVVLVYLKFLLMSIH